jgi:hypothetical protein
LHFPGFHSALNPVFPLAFPIQLLFAQVIGQFEEEVEKIQHWQGFERCGEGGMGRYDFILGA